MTLNDDLLWARDIFVDEIIPKLKRSSEVLDRARLALREPQLDFLKVMAFQINAFRKSQHEIVAQKARMGNKSRRVMRSSVHGCPSPVPLPALDHK
jgi:hypothetical protein